MRLPQTIGLNSFVKMCSIIIKNIIKGNLLQKYSSFWLQIPKLWGKTHPKLGINVFGFFGLANLSKILQKVILVPNLKQIGQPLESIKYVLGIRTGAQLMVPDLNLTIIVI